MSTEGAAKAPPEVAEDAPPAPNPAASAATTTGKPQNGKAPSHDGKWLASYASLKPCIRGDGRLDYSALDEAAQKRLHNFVREQRKCYRRRENGEPTPLTDERYQLLSEAKFDFKPNETSKAKREKAKEIKKRAAMALASSSSSSSSCSSSSSSASSSSSSNVEFVGTVASEKKQTQGRAKTSTPSFQSKLNFVGNITASKTPKTAAEGKMPANSKTPSSKGKAPSTPAPASSARKKAGKPTYMEMVHDAIVTLKDRTGSSVPAISKWILAHNEHVKAASANMFKNRVSTAIKQGAKEGRFVKVKASFKVNVEWIKKQKAAVKAKDVAKKKAEKQRQKELEKAKQQWKLEREKKKAKEEQQHKEKEVLSQITPEERAEAARKKKRKEEAEARKKYIDQQLRKRRYPIEDTKLHREDKEWGVKPPADVTKRPNLPHTLTCLVPPHLRDAGPKPHSGAVVAASASGTGALMGGENERGLVTDAIHVYHFFAGDVGRGAAVDPPVPNFSLRTLFYALDEVRGGNARAGRALPPLLTHLFVAALRALTASPPAEDDEESVDSDLGPEELRLQEDLSQLGEGLNAVSWSQICYFYMDLMERYYTSDVSLDEGVLPGEGTLDMRYFWNDDTMEGEDVEAGGGTLPNRYTAYLGNPQGVLAKVYTKLKNQAEPWTLKAEGLMALLRTLTDDVLARTPDLAEDIAGRGEKLRELQKEKRAAVIKFNKVRLAHEGPKKPARPKKSDDNERKAEDKKDEKDEHNKEGKDEKGEVKKDDRDDQVDSDPKEETEKAFVPTATKQQFVAAEKAYNKAAEAYDIGLNKLISRTEPIAFDRDFNAIYFFRPDPTMLHIEQLRQSVLPPEVKRLGPENPFSSWHVIDTKPLFEKLLDSLDHRGEREDEALVTCAGLTVLKRRLLDEKKENTRVGAREREKEALQRRLENSKTACDAEDGRRSGRLAGIAKDELKDLEEEVKRMTKAHEDEERQEELGREKASDYSLLTGLQLVVDLFVDQRATRSSKKSDRLSEVSSLADVPSHKLWMDEQIGGNGTLNVLAEALLELEEKCNNLSPWARQDIARGAWRKQLTDASCAWAIGCVMQLGPSADESAQEDDASENPYALTYDTSPTKKQKIDSESSGTSLTNIVNSMKLCLKDLELRVFEISFKKKSVEESETAAEMEGSSDDEDDAEPNSGRNCWKVKINALRRLPTTRYGLIRDIIVAAISVARKSHLNQVAVDLKAALQLLRPSAAGEAKSAAIQVLEKYGGYEGSDDEDADVDFDELAAAANAGDANVDEEAEAIVASLLCDEVRMINGSVGGDGFSDKSDWSDAIKDCKSVSRLAVMLQSFLSKADDTLSQMEEERDNLDSILGLNAKRTSRTKSSIKKHASNTPIWCNAELTNELVKARVKGYPWWPAHICTPKESIVADALKGSGYALISSVGNPSLFMVNEKDMVEFTKERNEDLSKYDKSTLDELHESTSIAKKLWRIQNRGVTSQWSKKTRPRFIEEKKTSH